MERPQTRPRSKSTFSFKSDKSHSSNKHEKHSHQPLRESAEEKRKSHLTSTTKANPNAAMNEAQPIAAALEKPTLQSLRSFQHTDTNGNVIADPDLSNPTRNRWERPLDTIKSFEAAIDNEYRRRAQTMRPDSSGDMVNGYASRRSSYYGGYDQNRYSQVGGYYGSRQAAAARESWVDNGYGPPNGYPRARYSQQRMQSDPGWNNRYSNGHGVYPPQPQGYQQSRETVNTGGSTGSHSDPYSTDPSSESSSIERQQAPPPPVAKPDLGEQYGFAGFGGGPPFQGPILEEYGHAGAPNDGYFPQESNVPPPVPAKTSRPQSNDPNVIKLSGQQGQNQANPSARPNALQRQNTEKRKSWFKRRFSKD